MWRRSRTVLDLVLLAEIKTLSKVCETLLWLFQLIQQCQSWQWNRCGRQAITSQLLYNIICHVHFGCCKICHLAAHILKLKILTVHLLGPRHTVICNDPIASEQDKIYLLIGIITWALVEQAWKRKFIETTVMHMQSCCFPH